MYSPEMWSQCFPILLPYGDGVFGLPRATPLTFQQTAVMHLLREELSYQTPPHFTQEAHAYFAAPVDSTTEDSVERNCDCVQCASLERDFVPPSQSRWSADKDLLSCYYDSWRRMEQVG